MAMNGNIMKPFVISREQIPPSSGRQDPGSRVRPFGAHELMGRAVSTAADLSWLELRAGEEMALRSDAEPALLVVLRGAATLTNGSRRVIEQGDVITLPGGQEWGQLSAHSELHALQVKLPVEAGAESDAEALTLERLLEHNRRRAQQALETPFFMRLRTGALNTSHKRSVACDAIRVFSDGFQTFLFTRQAMCRDEGYLAAFHEHLLEELGHNVLLKGDGNQRVQSDPILRATSSWFSHQMLTLDNAGKAVINLVLETSGYHFHTLAKPVFGAGTSADYFNVHAEADEGHMDVGMELLRDQHPDTYRRLFSILDEAWDMMVTVITRFAELIDIETNNS